MKFTVDVPDGLIQGISLERDDYNTKNPETAYATDEDFFSERAIAEVRAWNNKYGLTDFAKDAAKKEFLAKLPVEKRAAVEAAINAEL